MHHAAVNLCQALTKILNGDKTIEISTGVSGSKRIKVVNT